MTDAEFSLRRSELARMLVNRRTAKALAEYQAGMAALEAERRGEKSAHSPPPSALVQGSGSPSGRALGAGRLIRLAVMLLGGLLSVAAGGRARSGGRMRGWG